PHGSKPRECPMLARWIFASYSKLLAGALLASMAVALAGCNDSVAQKAEPTRPVLVATAHYEAEIPERSFVGTIRPRIESDLGFRVPGKVAKRLVEQAEAEQRAATGVLAQAAAAETRAKNLKASGWTTDAQLDQAKATADEARARLSRAERQVELTRNSLAYATLEADARGVVTATMIEPGQVVASGQTAI